MDIFEVDLLITVTNFSIFLLLYVNLKLASLLR